MDLNLRGWKTYRRAFFAVSGALLLATHTTSGGTLTTTQPKDTNTSKPSDGAVNSSHLQASFGEDDERVADALLLYKARKTEAAIYLLQQVLQDDRNNTTVLFKLGAIAIAAKNWAYAIEVFRQAADLRPEDIELRLVLMDVYKAYQMPIQEIIVGKEIAALDPRHPAALKRLSDLYEDQAMPEEEEATRRHLAIVAPDNYENLKRLASLLETNGDLWESALMYEQITKRFPDEVEDARTLARLYQEDGNRYSAIRQWQHVKEMPEGDSDQVSDALRQVSKAHKRELNLFNPFRIRSGTQRGRGPIDKINVIDVDLGYSQLFLLANREIGVSGHYRFQEYLPTAVVSGNQNINSHNLRFHWNENWDGNETVMRARLGYENVFVSGNTVALSPEDDDLQLFPFLERRSFGGTQVVGDLEVDRRLAPGVRLRGYVRNQIVQALDAYVRLLRQAGPGLTLSYSRPDGTYLEGRYEFDWISDGNKRSYGLFDASYPIFISAPIRNRQGVRDGYLFSVPPHQLRLGYRFEHINHPKPSPFYTTYRGEVLHSFIVSGQHHLGGKLYLTEEGVYSVGEVIQRQVGFRGGLAYQDSKTRTRLSLTYVNLIEEVLAGSQLNRSLTGRFRSQGFTFQLLYHLGRAPAKSESQARFISVGQNWPGRAGISNK